MPATHDKFGRPIVVVTGMGVVTSLGAGKDDNWKKLTAGESGIRTISRFSTEGLKTSIAGTVDFLKVEPFSSPDLSQKLAETAAEEAQAAGAPRMVCASAGNLGQALAYSGVRRTMAGWTV